MFISKRRLIVLECADWAVVGYDPATCCDGCHIEQQLNAFPLDRTFAPVRSHAIAPAGSNSVTCTEHCCGVGWKKWYGERYGDEGAPRDVWAAVVRQARRRESDDYRDPRYDDEGNDLLMEWHEDMSAPAYDTMEGVT